MELISIGPKEFEAFVKSKKVGKTFLEVYKRGWQGIEKTLKMNVLMVS